MEIKDAFDQKCEVCGEEVPIDHAAYYHQRADGVVHAAHLACGDKVNAENKRKTMLSRSEEQTKIIG